MRKNRIILILFLLKLLATDHATAQQLDSVAINVDSARMSQLNPSSISIAGKLYSKPGISVMESGNLGASPVLMIRGTSSIHLSNSPLIYVDGIPFRYTGSNPTFLSTFEPDRLGYLNPYDVAQINISPSAQDIPKIGGRGSAGVVDIRSERGEFGGTKVDFSANYGVNPASYSVPRMDGGRLKSYLWSRMLEDGKTAQELDKHPIFSNSAPQYNQNTDWLDLVSQQGALQDYHVKLKGGDGDANYLFAVGYTDRKGTIKETDFQRVGFRFNLDYTLSQKVRIYNNLSYTNTSGHYHEMGSNYAIHPVFVASAKAPFLGTNYINPSGGQPGNTIADVDTLGFSNPLALVNNMQNRHQYNRIDGVMGVNWDLANQWRLNSDLSVSYFNLSEKQYRPALGIVNDLYRIRQNAQRSSSEFYLNWQSTLTKTGVISPGIAYQASVYGAVETYEEKSLYGRKVNAGTDDFETLEQGTVDSASNKRFRSNLVTLLAKVQLDFYERMDFQGYLNVQGSSNFGSHERWNMYPGARLRIHALGSSANSMLNFALGYDRTGNHEIRNYYHYNQYYPVNYFGSGAVYLGNIANANLGPEITDTYELKAEGRPFGDYLQLSLGYYQKLTHDLITHKSILYEYGIAGLFENAGKVKNTGFEFALTSQLVNRDRFGWSISAALSTLSNKITDLPNGDIEQVVGKFTGIAREGEALGSFYGYNVLGVFENDAAVDVQKSDGTPYRAGDYRIEDLNGDGKINSLDRQVIGSPLPKFFGHFSTDVRYGKWGLSALFNFAQGADIYNAFNQQMHRMEDYANQDPSVLDRWISPEDPGSGLSRSAAGDPSDNGAQSSLWVEDGSYLKLKNLRIDYTLDGSAGRRFFKQIRIFLSGDNLFTITKYTGFDPEVNSLNNAMLRNIDFGATPLGRTYKLGIKASF